MLPSEGFKIRSTKFETNSNDQNSNDQNLNSNSARARFEHLEIRISDLFRISIFDIRIYAMSALDREEF